MKEYPSIDDLKRVEKWKSRDDLYKFIDFIIEIWHWGNMINLKRGKDVLGNPINILELHTGGWSGNEDIIDSLKKTQFFMMYHTKWERGGHWYFELPLRENTTKQHQESKNKV